ncbi:hypothetical protein IFT73_07550 [Aeromicrobium sp. CFBP 8757]|uniref:hypothetical protein n=1 Tax=Aeromicrobium sp. CFBP 8757 TaxID=2775288 RepID=UPI00178023AB|nr:hypothetical protein [Aeromicrobium sp. CFBP 8757]MBD8606707.1 hypothetical protein [Aeromicrobium sp. CFBP 8757]
MRTGRRVAVAAAVAAMATCVGGCTSDPGPRLAPAARAATDVVQRIDPGAATRLTLGGTLAVVAELPHRHAGNQVFFSSFAGDGEVLGAVVPEDDAPMGRGASAQSRPVLYDVASKTLTVLDDGARPAPTWVSDVVGDERAVAWVEGSDYNIAHSTFTIHSYDRVTREVAEIGRFDDPDGQIAYGGDLSIAGGTAYFSTSTFPGKKGQESVYAIPVDGSTPPEVVAAGGEQISIDGDTLRYWVRNPRDEREYPRHFTLDLATGATTAVPVNELAGEDGFCGAETTAAWEMWCTGRTLRPGPEMDHDEALITIREASGRTTEFAPFPVGSLNASVPHAVVDLGRWTGISVPTDDGQEREFLVDLDTEDVRVFPDNTSFGAMSPDRTTVLVTSYARGGEPAMQRVVGIPE